MPVAAVPKYLGDDFANASPGLRFGMYLELWGVNLRTEEKLWTKYDINYEVRGQQRQEREVSKDNKVSALSGATRLIARYRAINEALSKRYRCLADTIRPAALLRLEAKSISPFATGLGNEHPLENGFAFLWPYGLPYLPGSGVKGVVRRAAQELARGMWENDRGWRGLDAPQYSIERVRDGRKVTVPLSVIDVLFGREPPSGDRDHIRGALSFWDVIPQIKGDSLMVEIMTPHQSHYYQQKRDPKSGDSISPHDSGQPTPISFLTVPPGSTFDFHVVCDLAHLSRLTASREPGALDLLAEGATHWKNLLAAAFAHAFEWLGFGAKTAVGYGAMQVKQAAAANGQGAASGTGAAPAQSEPSARTETWENAKLSWKPGSQEMTAATSGRSSAPVKGQDAARALFADPARFEQLKKRLELKNVRVEVRIDGNLTVIVRIH